MLVVVAVMWEYFSWQTPVMTTAVMMSWMSAADILERRGPRAGPGPLCGCPQTWILLDLRTEPKCWGISPLCCPRAPICPGCSRCRGHSPAARS